MLKLETRIESFNGGGYLGWIDNIKGIIVQGPTIENVLDELLISLKVKIAYDYDLEIEDVK